MIIWQVSFERTFGILKRKRRNVIRMYWIDSVACLWDVRTSVARTCSFLRRQLSVLYPRKFQLAAMQHIQPKYLESDYVAPVRRFQRTP